MAAAHLAILSFSGPDDFWMVWFDDSADFAHIVMACRALRFAHAEWLFDSARLWAAWVDEQIRVDLEEEENLELWLALDSFEHSRAFHDDDSSSNGFGGGSSD